MQFAFRNRKLSASRPEDDFLTSDEVRACSQAALGIEWRHENENLYMHNRCRKHVGQHRIRADAHNLGLGVSMFENSGDSPRRNALLDSPAHNGHNHYRHVCVWFYRKRPVQVPRRTTERRSVSGGNEPNPAVGLRSTNASRRDATFVVSSGNVTSENLGHRHRYGAVAKTFKTIHEWSKPHRGLA